MPLTFLTIQKYAKDLSMNRDTQKVNRAIIKAMNKLVLFSLSERVVLSGGLQTALMGDYNSIWITTKCLENSCFVEIINFPKSPIEISEFNNKIKKFIVETNLKLNENRNR